MSYAPQTILPNSELIKYDRKWKINSMIDGCKIDVNDSDGIVVEAMT